MTRGHGASRYSNDRCRCPVCRQANTERGRRQAARRRGELAPYEPPPRTHGLRSTYVHGCRCAPCTEAERVYRADLRARHRMNSPVLGGAHQ